MARSVPAGIRPLRRRLRHSVVGIPVDDHKTSSKPMLSSTAASLQLQINVGTRWRMDFTLIDRRAKQPKAVLSRFLYLRSTITAWKFGSRAYGHSKRLATHKGYAHVSHKTKYMGSLRSPAQMLPCAYILLARLARRAECYALLSCFTASKLTSSSFLKIRIGGSKAHRLSKRNRKILQRCFFFIKVGGRKAIHYPIGKDQQRTPHRNFT